MNVQVSKFPKKTVLTIGLIITITLLALVSSSSNLPSAITTDNSNDLGYILVNKKAPDFALPDQNGNTVALANYKGKNLIIFFNEGEMCYPSCWNQIASLGTNPKLNNDSVATLSVVIDTRQQWNIPYEKKPEMMTETLLFDTSKEVSRAYNILNFPSSMHPGERPGHSYIVIDSEGIIRKIKDDPEMGINDTWLEQVVNNI